MRAYIKRGGVSSKSEYLQLERIVCDEIYVLDQEQQVIYDKDIQDIAMTEAMALGMEDFKVNIISYFYLAS